MYKYSNNIYLYSKPLYIIHIRDLWILNVCVYDATLQYTCVQFWYAYAWVADSRDDIAYWENILVPSLMLKSLCLQKRQLTWCHRFLSCTTIYSFEVLAFATNWREKIWVFALRCHVLESLRWLNFWAVIEFGTIFWVWYSSRLVLGTQEVQNSFLKQIKYQWSVKRNMRCVIMYNKEKLSNMIRYTHVENNFCSLWIAG